LGKRRVKRKLTKPVETSTRSTFLPLPSTDLAFSGTMRSKFIVNGSTNSCSVSKPGAQRSALSSLSLSRPPPPAGPRAKEFVTDLQSRLKESRRVVLVFIAPVVLLVRSKVEHAHEEEVEFWRVARPREGGGSTSSLDVSLEWSTGGGEDGVRLADELSPEPESTGREGMMSLNAD
jgi:hypothetical protein